MLVERGGAHAVAALGEEPCFPPMLLSPKLNRGESRTGDDVRDESAATVDAATADTYAAAGGASSSPPTGTEYTERRDESVTGAAAAALCDDGDDDDGGRVGTTAACGDSPALTAASVAAALRRIKGFV